ncbi:MAG TPA: response regulator [Gemmatimonadaceae bacterium]|nr:response regulator [Gemmatimonadaceae bacterium]
MQHSPSEHRQEESGSRRRKPRRVPTVVIADDSVVQRMMARAMLEAEGYRVLEAADGREVVDLVHHTHPDVVVMDVAMPRMDGVTAARRIRTEADDADVPIVFLSALSARIDRESALAAGGNDYLVKPVANQDLIRAVQRFVERSGRAREA